MKHLSLYKVWTLMRVLTLQLAFASLASADKCFIISIGSAHV